MLENKGRITNHAIKRYQERADYLQPKKKNHKSIKQKLINALRNLDKLEDLFYNKGSYFYKIKLSREAINPIYLVIRYDQDDIVLTTILSEDMFMKRYGNKINN